MIETTREVLDEAFANKNVILVGNSVELMNYPYGKYIDSFDTVVRFGKGIERNTREQIAVGKKTDVWVTGEFRSHMAKDPPIRELIDNIPILYNTNRWQMDTVYPKIDLMWGALDIHSDRELFEIFQKYNINYSDPQGKRLSAGILTIMFMCDKIKNYKSLTLIGFDFFAKVTTNRRGGVGTPASWYLPILNTEEEVHDHHVEVDIVQQYITDNKLKWDILSDLDKKIITNTKYGKF